MFSEKKAAHFIIVDHDSTLAKKAKSAANEEVLADEAY